jgi:tetratricopeptide (TPR) repeat protein
MICPPLRKRPLYKVRRGFWLALLGLLLASSTAFALSSEPVIRGEESLFTGKLGDAEIQLKQALRAEPKDARILSDLGRVYFHQGRYVEAEEKFRSALSAGPQREWVRCWSYAYLGKIYALRGDLPGAAVYFDKAMGLGETANCKAESRKYTAYLKSVAYARDKLTRVYETDCCVLHYGSGSEASEDILSIGKTVEGYHERISELLELSAGPQRVHLYLYPASLKYDLWEGREPLAKLRPHEIHVFYHRAGGAGPIEHEMVHIMTASLTDGNEPMPLLTEGLAEYVVGDPWNMPLDKWAKGFVESGDFVPVVRLAEAEGFRKLNPILTYMEAGSFVNFLMERYGRDSFFRLLAGNTGWREVYGFSLEELAEQWLLRLKGLKVTEGEMELIDYRLMLGDFYGRRESYRQGLPWAGVSYEVAGRNVVVSRVAPASPAESAGLRVGDLVRDIEQVAITGENSWKLASVVHGKSIGDVISLTVERGGEERSFLIRLGSEPKGGTR